MPCPGSEFEPHWRQTLFWTQAQHLCFIHDSIWFVSFDTIICLSNFSCQLWNRILKIKKNIFKKSLVSFFFCFNCSSSSLNGFSLKITKFGWKHLDRDFDNRLWMGNGMDTWKAKTFFSVNANSFFHLFLCAFSLWPTSPMISPSISSSCVCLRVFNLNLHIDEPRDQYYRKLLL